MNSGNDPRGLDFPFRQSALNIIKISLKDYYALSSDDHTRLRSLDEIANKFEHKVFVNATSRDDYINTIKQKLTQTAKMFPPSSNTGNQNLNNHDFSQQNYPDCRLTGDETSSAYVHSQNYSGSSVLSSIFDSGTTNTDMVVQFRRAKLSYLPELENWLKTMEDKYLQAQTVTENDSLKKHMVSVRQMIKLLSIAENQLLLIDKQKIRRNMNIVIAYYNKFVKNGSTSFAMNQEYQLSSPRRMNNSTQNNTLTNPVLMNQPVISSSTMNPGFSSGSTEQVDMKTNTTTSSVTPSVSQPEKRKHPIDSSVSVPTTNNGKQSTNAARRASKKPCSKPRAKSSGNSHEAWLNLAISRSSKRSSISTKHSKISTPPGSMTPSCGKNAVTETYKDASNSEEQLILENSVPIVGAPGILSGSPILSVSTDSEPTEQHSEDEIKLASMETLVDVVSDMKLPDISYQDLDDDRTIDVDDCMSSEDQQPFKRLKCDVQSVSMDVSVPPSNNSAVEQSSKLEPNKNHIVLGPYQNLFDEIKKVNQNLSGTVIEIVEESSNLGNGTIVRCTYSPGAESIDILRSMFSSHSMNLSVEFLVPLEYPTLPPKIVLDGKPPDFGIAIEMTKMAKFVFPILYRRNNSSSVSELAQLWNRCAQTVVLTYEKLFVAEIPAPEMVTGTLLDPYHDQVFIDRIRGGR